MDSDLTLALVKAGLSAELLKHKTAAMNVAGHGNPNYIPKKLSFSIVLEKTISDSGTNKANVELESQLSERSSAETAGLDEEVMFALNAESRYRALVQMANKKFGLLKLSIKGN